ncbi:DUF5655 domain-containing protein [uncultured Fusobacterium sp.]|uniref:DUF5655 domain-containing protein n=1 Tax=uncultured Fusobacterium sp. TaxID=159267 RepID=UPI0015A60E4B|nr:DUF5655 domain-containing protein [uncultured Fusobacterium sp.]
MLFKILNEKINKISENEFKLEKDLQNFVEKNLEILLGLEFVKSECIVENYRLDTLAFDKENKSFVIIEYKRGNSYSVIDQGYSYLSKVLNNRADIILEYNETLNKTLKRDDIDWTQTKVIFISQNFNKFQKDSLNFKNLPIELYEIKRYDNGIISFNMIKGEENSEDINTISKVNTEIQKVSKEIKKYSIEEHLKGVNDNVVELFYQFKERMEFMFPEIEITAKKLYIAFKNNKKNLADFHLQKNSLKIWLNAKYGKIDEFKNISKNVSNTGHWGNGDYEFSMKDDREFEYIISLIKSTNNLFK